MIISLALVERGSGPRHRATGNQETVMFCAAWAAEVPVQRAAVVSAAAGLTWSGAAYRPFTPIPAPGTASRTRRPGWPELGGTRSAGSPPRSAPCPRPMVERVRIEAAQRALTGTDDLVDTIAAALRFPRHAETASPGLPPARQEIAPADTGPGSGQPGELDRTTYGLLIFDGAEELDFIGPWRCLPPPGHAARRRRIPRYSSPKAVTRSGAPSGLRVARPRPGRPSGTSTCCWCRAAWAIRREVSNPEVTCWIRRGFSDRCLDYQRLHRCPCSRGRGRSGPRAPGRHLQPLSKTPCRNVVTSP